MRVRLARPEDDARIGDLLVEAFVEAYAEKMPEVVVTDLRKSQLRDLEAKRRQGLVFVLEEDTRGVVGTVTLFKPGAPDSEAWLPNCSDLRHLAMDRSLHGQGLSRPLLDEAERVAWEELQVDAICLHVRRGAFGVARLYEKRGYQRMPEGDLARPEIYLEAYRLSRPGPQKARS